MKLFLYVLLVLVGALLIYALWHGSSHARSKSTVIILNGPSASGKSSIQKAFTAMRSEPWLKIGIDNFFVGVLPEKWIFNPPVTDDFVMKGVPSTDTLGHEVFTLEVGPAGERIIDGMHRAIQGYADAGNNVIVDYIAYNPAWLPALVKRLKKHRVIVIGVTTPLEILEQREKARATSPIGHARSHYDNVHELNRYDLMIDTSKMTPEQAAARIAELL